MSEEAVKALTPSEFTCKACGKVAKVFRDWQRCWPCAVATTSRDLRTLPGFCYECHLDKRHER